MKKDEITLKNTKQEILDALNAALEREKNIAKIKSNPAEEEKERKVKAAVEETKKNVDTNIFSNELINKFKDLEIAIQAEEEKLKNLYDIDKELLNLTLVMNAGKEAIAELEKEKDIATKDLEEKIKNLEDEYKAKMETLNKEYELKTRTLKIEREREEEEYNYKIKRDRTISNNEWEDEKKNRETLLTAMEEETKKTLEEVKNKENLLNELQTKVDDIPNLLLKESEKTRNEVTLELEKEHKYSTELLKKDYQNTIDRQNDKIASLQEEISKSNALNVSLQDKIDKAYLQIKELASKTVEANGGVKILGNSQVETK